MKKSILTKVSTPPNEDSLKWAGKQNSILANILLWGVWVCRLLSLLQWIKVLYRAQPLKKLKRKASVKNTLTKNDGSDRPDVPVMLWELYFIIWLLIMATIYLSGWQGLFVDIIVSYGVFDSITWVVYYTVLRRFFEDNYSIYHELEALTLLLLLIPVLALGFANLYGNSFKDTLVGVLGAGSDNMPLAVSIFGAVFAAIVIAMIISTFPTEAVKKSYTHIRMLIIGGGDVVKERLLPAVENSGVARSVDIFDINPAVEAEYDKIWEQTSDKKTSMRKRCQCMPNSKKICEEIESTISGDGIVWIETPSDSHIEYLKYLLENTKTSLIVVEKPITTKKDEVLEVERIISDESKRRRIFFLSYYILEKAMPLYYLSEGNPIFLKYLDIEDKSVVQNWRLLLGELKSIGVHLIEGRDTRLWMRGGKNGGQRLETFIHNVLITTLFCGPPQKWEISRFEENDMDDGFCNINMTAMSQKTNINLSLQKSDKAEERIGGCAKLVFAEGTVKADFDEKVVEIYFERLNKVCTVSIKDAYKQKYSVVVDLVKRVKEGECTSCKADGLINQLATIKWLLELEKEI